VRSYLGGRGDGNETAVECAGNELTRMPSDGSTVLGMTSSGSWRRDAIAIEGLLVFHAVVSYRRIHFQLTAQIHSFDAATCFGQHPEAHSRGNSRSLKMTAEINLCL
jgi:hypothetical protein